MKKSPYLVTLFFALILSLSFSVTQSRAGEKIYRMSGEITAIDLRHNTVVVEVPLGDKPCTVAGPLSSKAVLKKDGKSVVLADFRRGDRVLVKWKVTEQGHVVLLLECRTYTLPSAKRLPSEAGKVLAWDEIWPLPEGVE